MLLTSLCDAGYSVSSASGALDISGIDKRVSKIVDIKTPDSGEVTKIDANLDYLTRRMNWFVLCSKQDDHGQPIF